MAIPFTDRKTVFDSISATTTVELHNLFRGGHFASTVLLEVVGSSSQNWTLDIQGKVTEDGTYTNMDYQQIWQAGSVSLANAQLTVNDTTRRFYVVPNTPQFVQLVATRTAGNLTVYASMSSEPFGALTPNTGNLTYSGGTKATVGSSSGEVVAANTSRKFLAIVNDSNDEVFLGIGETAVINEGIRLNAGGGSVVFGGSGLPLMLLAVNGIASGASKNVTVQEGT